MAGGLEMPSKQQLAALVGLIGLLTPIVLIALYVRDTDNRTEANALAIQGQREFASGLYGELKDLRGDMEDGFERQRIETQRQLEKMASRDETRVFIEQAMQKALLEFTARIDLLLREQYELKGQSKALEGRVRALEEQRRQP